MNKFEFELTKNKIQQLTTKTALKQAIRTHYNEADTHHTLNETRVLHKGTSINTAQQLLYEYELFKIARARYLELAKTRISDLPQYAQNTMVTIHMSMTIEEAYKWIKQNETS